MSKIVGDLAHYEGVVLAHHGLVTWAEDSNECYQRTIDVVDTARAFVAEHSISPGPPPSHDDMPDEELENLLLHLRGVLSHTGHRVLRVDDRLREVADHPQLDTIVAGGVSSADHMLRIKPLSVALSDTGPEEVARAVEEYASAYESYVERNAESMPEGYSGHDSMPRVALVPGVGAITTGQNSSDAKVAADIAVHTHGVARTVLDSFGEPEPLSDVET
ncbi:MAG: hypothetical protein GY911_00160, partial [Actinomycetales bacterium]|nr:hypothetical protein [Actinomycetales bacterium]